MQKKRVCELEEKQWRTDRNESGTTPCLTANCGGLNTECIGDGGAFAGVPGRAAMPGDRNTASSGSSHEYMVNESHTENVPLHRDVSRTYAGRGVPPGHPHKVGLPFQQRLSRGLS